MENYLASELHQLQFKSILWRTLDNIIYSTNTADVMNHNLLIGCRLKYNIF